MFNLIWKKLEDEKDQSFKTIYYQQMFLYLVGEEHIMEALKWLSDNKVRTPEGNVIEGVALQQEDRHRIIRCLFALPDFDQKEKDKVLAQELEKDTSQKAKLLEKLRLMKESLDDKELENEHLTREVNQIKRAQITAEKKMRSVQKERDEIEAELTNL